ncbi:chromate transporter [Streptosporangium sp. NPDC023615]|uniref:chromate transporter n=1 Tax=Streptosporangium sp. NPDC023615 TaxID=3154794 RepID=UPI003424B251
MTVEAPHDVIPFRQAVRAWFGISLQTFGGPAGQIAVMQRTLVEERRWIGQQRFNHALNYCMLLPGPEAQQLAVYVGWLLNGTRGGLVAGTLFVLPGMLALLALSAVYVLWQDTSVVVALFAGIGPAVLAVVAQAVIRVARRSLTHPLFVAFLGAYRDPGTLNPWAGALLGALLTTWVTFVPCFLFIFLGAPYVEKLRHNAAVSAALTGITAAVVGVIAGLALYFAEHTLFGRTFVFDQGPFHLRLPDPATISPVASAVTVAALVMTFVLKWPMLRILGICALLGLATVLLSRP